MLLNRRDLLKSGAAIGAALAMPGQGLAQVFEAVELLPTNVEPAIWFISPAGYLKRAIAGAGFDFTPGLTTILTGDFHEIHYKFGVQSAALALFDLVSPEGLRDSERIQLAKTFGTDYGGCSTCDRKEHDLEKSGALVVKLDNPAFRKNYYRIIRRDYLTALVKARRAGTIAEDKPDFYFHWGRIRFLKNGREKIGLTDPELVRELAFYHHNDFLSGLYPSNGPNAALVKRLQDSYISQIVYADYHGGQHHTMSLMLDSCQDATHYKDFLYLKSHFPTDPKYVRIPFEDAMHIKDAQDVLRVLGIAPKPMETHFVYTPGPERRLDIIFNDWVKNDTQPQLIRIFGACQEVRSSKKMFRAQLNDDNVVRALETAAMWAANPAQMRKALNFPAPPAV